jgi:hypothetical protein
MSERRGARERIWVVDRLGRRLASLVEDESGVTRDVARRDLPQDTREGDVLRVPVDASGEPDWQAATADESLRQARLDEARAALERLRRRDPGGDVKL